MSYLVMSCSPRSGSTALVEALNKTPNVCILNEAGVFSPGWSAADRLAAEPWILTKGQREGTLSLIYGSNDDTLARLSSCYSVVGDKFPTEYLAVKSLRVDWDNTVYVHLLRDGRDVVTSAIRHNGKAHWGRGTVSAAESLWLDNVAEWERAAGWLVARGVPTLSLTYPYVNFDKLGEFIGVEIPDTARDYYTPVNHGAWRTEQPDLMTQLSTGFLKTLHRYGFLEE